MKLTAYGPTGARKHDKVEGLERPKSITIDIHAHIWIDEAEKIAAPHMVDVVLPPARYVTEASVAANQKHYQERSPHLRDLELRLKDMDAMSIDVQALIPVPKQSYYWIPEAPSQEAVRTINDRIAGAVKTNPERFIGFGTIPMQNPEFAVSEMDYCINTLGFKGIQILTNINGREVADPDFEPVWAKAQELDTLIFLHPDGFTHGERLRDHYFINIIGNPFDTSLAAHHLIFKGVLERYPDLRVLLAHGGGYLAAYSGRIDHAWAAREDAHGKLPKPPSTYLKKMFFDSVVFTHHQLRYLIDIYGVDHVVMGTDYPFDMAEYRPVEHIQLTENLDEIEIAALVGGNAKALLKLA